MTDSQTSEEEAREYAESIINTVREPLIVLDQDLKVVSASRSFYDAFKVKPEETEGQLIYDLGNKQWDIPKLRELLETLLPQKTTLDDYKIEHEFADLGRRTMLVNAREIHKKSGKDRLILLAIEDITERKKAEKQLEESKEKSEEKERCYRLLFEQSPLGVFHTDKKGVIVSCNDNFIKIIGSSKKALIGLDMNTLPDQKIVRNLRKALDGSRGYYEDVYHSVTAKQSTPVRVYFSPLRAEDGTVIGCTGIVEDITEQTQSEQALRRSENYYRAIFETTGAAMFIIEEDTIISHVNTNFETLAGYSKQEVEGKKSWTEFIHADDVARMKEYHYLRRSDPRTAPLNYEFRFFVRNGGLRHGFLTVDMIPDTTQTVVSLIDITERKRAEDALRQRESLLQRIFDILPIGLWFADEKGRLLRGNPAGVEIWGAEPLVDPSEYGVFAARRYPSGEAITPDTWALAHTIRGGATILDELLEIDAFDGKKKIILNSTAPVLDEKGNIEGAVVINQDVTEREKLQSQLNQAQKMESVGRLAGGVAHDFNNKLAIINGYAEMAIDMMDPSDPLRETIREIYTAGKKSADIVRQLMAFARQQTINPVQLDLNETISGMLKMLQRLIGENIELVWHPGNNLWPVKLDPSQADQTMTNLAVNARDAIADVGKIKIETNNVEVDENYCTLYPYFVPGQYVMLSVSDDGSGMDKETLTNLFEPFFTTKEIGKGTGLGLAMIYGIVKQNNGFINVDSEPGKGTTVKIYLPRLETEESALEPAKESTPTRQLPTGTETILIVEDEIPVLQMSRQILERLGYTVQTAGNPSAALQLFEAYNGTIHLLITDVIMPEMNGRDLASQMAMSRPGLKILYMSGYTADVIAHKGVIDEGVQFIQKPFSMQELAVKVRKAIEPGSAY
ncbi:MAG: PAS domain S-box protein [Desulfobacterales bacterium]|nr:PAS domain S-box protein [Desulfobacterales bacterium]